MSDFLDLIKVAGPSLALAVTCLWTLWRRYCKLDDRLHQILGQSRSDPMRHDLEVYLEAVNQEIEDVRHQIETLRKGEAPHSPGS